MRYLLLLGILLGYSGLTAAAPLAAQGYFTPGRGIDARIWVEDDRDFYRRGDRLTVRFTVSDDAYVAVVHIDPEGNLDILHPATPWDNEYVRGGGVHTIRSRGTSAWTIRSGSGIGYLYLLASPTPLDFSHFRGRAGSPWEWGYAGRAVRGDPFLALDQITRLLLPRWPNVYYQTDYYSYHVGRVHRYPAYACSDRYDGYGWGWTPSYGSCSRLDSFLRTQPYYYDTRRYRGDRRAYLRQYDRLDPRHGFKEAPDTRGRDAVTPGGVRPNTGATPNRGTNSAPPSRPSTSGDRRDPVPAGASPPRSATPAARPAPEQRPRPNTERRPQESAGPERARPTPSTGTRSPARGGGESSPSPSRRPSPGQP